MEAFQAAADPGTLAGVPLSTIAGAESTGGSAPSWVSMVRVAAQR
jgi:hypothetical protein